MGRGNVAIDIEAVVGHIRPSSLQSRRACGRTSVPGDQHRRFAIPGGRPAAVAWSSLRRGVDGRTCCLQDIRYYIFEILKALDYCHSQGIMRLRLPAPAIGDPSQPSVTHSVRASSMVSIVLPLPVCMRACLHTCVSMCTCVCRGLSYWRRRGCARLWIIIHSVHLVRRAQSVAGLAMGWRDGPVASNANLGRGQQGDGQWRHLAGNWGRCPRALLRCWLRVVWRVARRSPRLVGLVRSGWSVAAAAQMVTRSVHTLLRVFWRSIRVGNAKDSTERMAGMWRSAWGSRVTTERATARESPGQRDMGCVGGGNCTVSHRNLPVGTTVPGPLDDGGIPNLAPSSPCSWAFEHRCHWEKDRHAPLHTHTHRHVRPPPTQISGCKQEPVERDGCAAMRPCDSTGPQTKGQKIKTNPSADCRRRDARRASATTSHP